MSEKESYRNKIQAKLDQWNAEIDKFEARADEAGSDLQLEYYEQLKKLRALQEEADAKLEQLNDAADDAWEGLREQVDIASDAIDRTLQTVTSRFG